MSRQVLKLQRDERVRLKGVNFYREPDSVTFVKESGDRLYFKAVFTYAKPPKEHYGGAFSIFKEAVSNGAIEITKLSGSGRA